MKLKKIIDECINVYRAMQDSRYASKWRSDKKELLELESINNTYDPNSPEKTAITQHLKNLQNSLINQTDSKLKMIVDLIMICVRVQELDLGPKEAFHQIKELNNEVKKNFTPNWLGFGKGDQLFCDNFDKIVLKSLDFILGFSSENDSSLYIDILTKERQLTVTTNLLEQTILELEEQGQKLNKIDFTQNHQKEQIANTTSKLKTLANQSSLDSNTENSAVLITHALNETLQKQGEQLKKIEKEKSETVTLLRTKITEVEELEEKKQKQTIELLRVNCALDELDKERNLTKQENQKLIATIRDLETKLHTVNMKYATYSKFFLLNSSEIGVTQEDFKKLKELRSSDNLLKEKYNKFKRIDKEAAHVWVDTYYLRYKDTYHGIFNSITTSKLKAESEDQEKLIAGGKKQQLEKDCNEIGTHITQHYPLADFAKHVGLVAPNTVSEKKYIDKVGQSEEYSKAAAEFAEEVMKRINNLINNNVEKLEKRLGGFARRNLELIDKCIEEDKKQELENIKRMVM